ncbi:hypothetical protein MLD38_017399 [Melastoma candidum]|uniref:Uncharacterized protein n=1 Tax=Melastoma candidum TaxID=119954 RepID=A0ACB9QPX7_9MYRT|nr:hypothetical protein MLD38_017399 [Melastoma candidum]
MRKEDSKRDLVGTISVIGRILDGGGRRRSASTDAARRLLGSTLRDRLLIRTSDSFASLFLFAIGLLLLIVSLIHDRKGRGM